MADWLAKLDSILELSDRELSQRSSTISGTPVRSRCIACIRDVRSSEKVFGRKVLDIYGLSMRFRG